MAISNELIIEWIDLVSQLDGLMMDPVTLADDMILMAYYFNEPDDFLLAISQVVKAMKHLIQERVATSQLERSYRGWTSYHFQSKRVQGKRADLRIVFQKHTAYTIRIKGFGHRHIPIDIYRRLHTRVND